MLDSSRNQTGTSEFGPWSQPSLGEALEDEAFVVAEPVSRSQRRRTWDREHAALQLLYCEAEHQRALRHFRLVAAASVGASCPCGCGCGDPMIAHQD